MDRKKFIKASGVGIGLSIFPSFAQEKDEVKSTAQMHPKIAKSPDGDILNVIGDIQTHKLVGSETGNQIVEWISNLEPGVGIPPHIHTKEDEIFRIIKGEVEIMINGKATILKEGDIAFAPKNIPHAWKVVGTEKAKMITSAFPAGIEHMFKELSQLPAGPPDFEKVASICAKQGIRFV